MKNDSSFKCDEILAIQGETEDKEGTEDEKLDDFNNLNDTKEQSIIMRKPNYGINLTASKFYRPRGLNPLANFSSQNKSR